MSNLASPNEGASVLLASSNDDGFPADAIIDGNPDTYWLTTGLFPQQFIISFRNFVAIDSILMQCTKVHRVRIERSQSSGTALDFEAVIEQDAEIMDDEIQSLKFEFNKLTASHIKIIITEAFDHFVSVNSLIVTGKMIR